MSINFYQFRYYNEKNQVYQKNRYDFRIKPNMILKILLIYSAFRNQNKMWNVKKETWGKENFSDNDNIFSFSVV